MKRPNHKIDLDTYEVLSTIYVRLISQILERTDFELEDKAHEKDVFRPIQENNFPDKYLELFDKAGIENRQLRFTIDGFECAFMLHQVIKFKRLYERKLVTPRHHVYYTELEAENKAA